METTTWSGLHRNPTTNKECRRPELFDKKNNHLRGNVTRNKIDPLEFLTISQKNIPEFPTFSVRNGGASEPPEIRDEVRRLEVFEGVENMTPSSSTFNTDVIDVGAASIVSNTQKARSSSSLGPLGSFDVSDNGIVFNFGSGGYDIFGNLSKKTDYADDELKQDLSNNSIGFFSKLNMGGCVGGKKNDKQNSKNVIENGGDKKIDDKNEHSYAAQLSASLQDISNNLNSNPIFEFVQTNVKYVEYPFIYFKWLEKKIGIHLCKGITKIQKVADPTNDEMRIVNKNIASIFTLLISVLITYNWFFLMFYEYDNERIPTWKISSKYFKSFSPLLNFLFEFTIYPVDCMNWFMLYFFPKMMKRIFNSNDVIFLVMYITVFKIVNTWGNGIVDLFYDSMKMFFNHHIKPWDDALKHIYTNPKKPVSPTLRTYWFFHLLIFGAQIPSLIPSFYKGFYNPEENPSAEEKERRVRKIVDDVLPKEKLDTHKTPDNMVKGGGETEDFMDREIAVIDKSIKTLEEKPYEASDKKTPAQLRTLRSAKSLYNEFIALNEKKTPFIKKRDELITNSKKISNDEAAKKYTIKIEETNKDIEKIDEELKTNRAGIDSIKAILQKILPSSSVATPDATTTSAPDATTTSTPDATTTSTPDATTTSTPDATTTPTSGKIASPESANNSTFDFTGMQCNPNLTTEEGVKSALFKEKLKEWMTNNNGYTTEQRKKWIDEWYSKWNADLAKNKPHIAEFIKKCQETSPKKRGPISMIGDTAASLAKDTVSSAATTFLSGAKSLLTDILRFIISHYFVTIAGMSVSFYLLFYSFFGMIHFSTLNIVETIIEIEKFIDSSSMNDYMARCGIETRCTGTIWQWMYDKLMWLYHKLVQIMFKHLYLGSIIAILLFAMKDYAKSITSSKQLKATLQLITFISGVLIIIIYICKTLFFNKLKSLAYEDVKHSVTNVSKKGINTLGHGMTTLNKTYYDKQPQNITNIKYTTPVSNPVKEVAKTNTPAAAIDSSNPVVPTIPAAAIDSSNPVVPAIPAVKDSSTDSAVPKVSDVPKGPDVTTVPEGGPGRDLPTIIEDENEDLFAKPEELKQTNKTEIDRINLGNAIEKATVENKNKRQIDVIKSEAANKREDAEQIRKDMEKEKEDAIKQSNNQTEELNGTAINEKIKEQEKARAKLIEQLEDQKAQSKQKLEQQLLEKKNKRAQQST